jgi:transposase
VIKRVKSYEVRSYIPEKKQKGRRDWQDKRAEQQAVYSPGWPPDSAYFSLPHISSSLAHSESFCHGLLAEVHGLGVDSAQQIIAEVGAKATTFASAKNLASRVGVCPGEEESAGVKRSKRSPKATVKCRILNQAADAAVKHKGSIFEIVYGRFVPRLGHNKTIGAIAHRLCHLIWIILHNGVRCEERGPSVCEKAKRARTSRMIRTLRALGYRVEAAVIPA